MGKLLGLVVLAGAVAVGATVRFSRATPDAPSRRPGPAGQAETAPTRAAGDAMTGSLGLRGPHSPEVALLLYHLRYGSNLKRREVALELKRLGVEARSAVPELIEFLSHKDDWWGRVRHEIECALVSIMGEDAVPAALALLDLEDGRARASGVAILVRVRGEAAVPVLARLLKKDDRAGRAAAGWLAQLGEPGRTALVSAVADNTVPLEVIGEAIVEAGKPVALPLAALLEAGDRATRERAARMLKMLGKNARPAADGIVRALQDADFGDRIPLVNLLPSLPDVPAPAIHATASLLRELPLAELGARIREIWASGRELGELSAEERRLIHTGRRRNLRPLFVLAELGPAAREALPALVAIMDAGDPVAGAAAAAAHWRISEDPGTALNYLIASLREDSGGMAHPAIFALFEMGEQAEPAVPALLRELESSILYRRYSASNALAQIGDAALPAIRQWLKTTENPSAADTLFMQFGTKLGKEAEERLEEEVRKLRALRYTDSPELIALGVNEEDPLPDLRRSLREPGGDDTHLALHALRRLGAKAAPAVPELVALLDDEDRRFDAAEGLAAIGPAAAAAVPALERYLEDPWVSARLAVVRALWKITRDTRYRDLAFRPADVEAGDTWALPLLLDTLNGDWLEGRKDAVAALVRLGPAARPALPDFARIAADPAEDEYLRDLARAAPAKIKGDG